jgi:hypothetical protein
MASNTEGRDCGSGKSRDMNETLADHEWLVWLCIGLACMVAIGRVL